MTNYDFIWLRVWNYDFIMTCVNHAVIRLFGCMCVHVNALSQRVTILFTMRLFEYAINRIDQIIVALSLRAIEMYQECIALKQSMITTVKQFNALSFKASIWNCTLRVITILVIQINNFVIYFIRMCENVIRTSLPCEQRCQNQHKNCRL